MNEFKDNSDMEFESSKKANVIYEDIVRRQLERIAMISTNLNSMGSLKTSTLSLRDSVFTLKILLSPYLKADKDASERVQTLIKRGHSLTYDGIVALWESLMHIMDTCNLLLGEEYSEEI